MPTTVVCMKIDRGAQLRDCAGAASKGWGGARGRRVSEIGARVSGPYQPEGSRPSRAVGTG